MERIVRMIALRRLLESGVWLACPFYIDIGHPLLCTSKNLKLLIDWIEALAVFLGYGLMA
jgi:hypothetical protein